jgi:N-acetylglucosaminyldiphosphoundecaprenol N-acetyl-beta-D-mannosaminyltransferase
MESVPAAPPPRPRAERTRVRVGEVWIDAVTFAQALDDVEALVEQGQGGAVFTPNIDHVVNAAAHQQFREAYARASLSLADGQPVVWASRLLRARLPERVSGSDLLPPLMQRAAQKGLRVYLLGGAPGVAEKAAQALRADPGVQIAGVDAPLLSLEPSAADDAAIERICAARPHLVLVALGSPKQELWIDRALPRLAPAVCLGIGAGLDFIAGTVRRAPRWMRRSGLEWLYRLGQEPRRLARRYLWNDPKFVLLLWRTLRLPREQRVRRWP